MEKVNEQQSTPDRVSMPVEMAERIAITLEQTANDTLIGRNMADELRALLASHANKIA